VYNTYGNSMMFELTGEVKTYNGKWTNVTMFLDDNSEGHQFVSELIAKFEWRKVEESSPFGFDEY
jgi:hypothetical protein